MRYLLLFVFISCGRHSSEKTYVNIHMPKKMMASLSGGLYLYGLRDGGKERLSRYINGERFSQFLNNGNWEFFTLGFSGGTLKSPSHLSFKCAVAAKSLKGGSGVPVPLDLSTESCKSPVNRPFSPAAFSIEAGSFFSLKITSCTTESFKQVSSGTSSCTAGRAKSMVIELTSYMQENSEFKEISSEVQSGACLQPDSNGVFTTGIRLPVGNVIPMGLRIRFFDSANCERQFTRILSFKGLIKYLPGGDNGTGVLFPSTAAQESILFLNHPPL